MKRQGILIIVIASLFAALCVAYFAFVKPLTTPEEVPEETPETEEGEELGASNRFFMFGSIERTDIDEIKIENKYGTYAFENNGKGEFHIKGFDSIPYDKELFATLVNISSYTLSKTKVGSNLSDEKIAEYGLSEPQASWTVTAKGGKSFKVFVGDRLLTGGGYYCMLEGRRSVYVLGTDVEKAVLVPVEGYVTPVLCAGISQDDYYLTDDFTMYKNGEQLFSLRLVDKSEQINKEALAEVMMDYPTDYYPNSSLYYELIYSYMNLNADACLKLGATAEDFKKAGLDDPAHVITFEYSGTKFELKFSALSEDGVYYATSNLYPNMISTCLAENFEYLEYDLIDWIDDYVYQQYITNIREMSVKTDKVEAEYSLEHSFKSDGDALLYVKANGEAFSEEQVANFRQYYKSLIAVSIQDYYTNDEYCKLTKDEMEALIADKENAYLTFEYTTLSGDTTTLAFYQYSTRHSLVTINGVGEFYVLTDLIKKIENDTVRILAGETVTAFDKN
ncbi:MAG: DUF4340 domain-containing protein [Clostridia bacterium]|nr:DUF4340 domain-containing protein [Clostridia bacterium]